MSSFFLAARFLTILPWPRASEEPDAFDFAAAVSRFPFVGLSLGVLLVFIDFFVGWLAPISVRDGLLVIALVVLTGGLHLDGLADLADAMCGGVDAESRLRIMKDSVTGSMGAMAICGILLLKFAALQSLPSEGRWAALLLAPTFSRAAMAYLMVSLPYARSEGGTGSVFAEAADPGHGYTAVGWALVASLVFDFFGGILVGVVAGAVTLFAKRVLGRKLGGGTGDGYGAAGEVVETISLLAFAIKWGN